MELKFVKASPCSNTTVLVLDRVPSEKQGKLAGVIMDYDHLCAEQLGYITEAKHKNSILRLEMSGGEFCGNALLSAAAFSIYKNYTKKESFYLESSGTDELLECCALGKSGGKYWAKAQMPSGYSIDGFAVQIDLKKYNGKLVNLPGISHFVFEGAISKSVYSKISNEITRIKSAEAYGVIPYQKMSETLYSITPYVYVPKADSRVFEKACGSGSYALGLAVCTAGGIIKVLQPAGELEVTIGGKNYISGEVFFSCEGTVFVDGQLEA